MRSLVEEECAKVGGGLDTGAQMWGSCNVIEATDVAIGTSAVQVETPLDGGLNCSATGQVAWAISTNWLGLSPF